MSTCRKLVLVILITLSCFSFAAVFSWKVKAQSTSSLIWEAYSAKSTANDGDLRSLLEEQVQKVIAAGHLAPFRALYGEGTTTYYWYHSYDTVYTLSLAYPYVSSSTQSKIKNYLLQEMQKYPVWSSSYLDPKIGARRQPDELGESEIGSLRATYANRPKLFALYALWLYASNTGDWQYIQSNWNSISSFYSNNRSETASYYTSIAGAIGYARMASQKGTQDTGAISTATSDIQTGFTNGKNVLSFAQKAENAYKGTNDDWEGWTREEIYIGFHFLDITPEIGRFLREDTTIRQTVIGTQTVFSSSGGSSNEIVYEKPSEEYSLRRAEYFYPLWYMAQAPTWSRYFGEGSGIAPDARGMIFPLKAWVLQEPAIKLRTYVDVPDALIGDYYYMQNLVRTIEAHGQPCWTDVRTNTSSCGIQPSTPPVTVAPTPTPLAPSCPTDLNLNGSTDIGDYALFVNSFLKTPVNQNANFDKIGGVDLLDYSIFVKAFLKPCG